MESIIHTTKRDQKTIHTTSLLYQKGFKHDNSESSFLIDDLTLNRKHTQEIKEVDDNYEQQQKYLISRSLLKEQVFTNQNDLKFYFDNTINTIELPSMVSDIYFNEMDGKKKYHPRGKYEIKPSIQEDKEVENCESIVYYQTLFLENKNQDYIGVLYDSIKNNVKITLFLDQNNSLYVQKQIKIDMKDIQKNIDISNKFINREIYFLKKLKSSKTNITLQYLGFNQFSDGNYQYFNINIQSGIKNLNDIKQQYQITQNYDEYAFFLEYAFFQLLEKLNNLHFIEQIAHSDIKPLNIVLGYDLELYFIDFGASVLLNDKSDYSTYLINYTPQYNFIKNIKKKFNWKRHEIINCDTSQLILTFLSLMSVQKNKEVSESYKLLKENDSEEFLKNLLDPFKKLGKYLCECLNQIYQDSNDKYICPQIFIFSKQFHEIGDILKRLQDIIYDEQHNQYFICCINNSSQQIIEVLANNHNGFNHLNISNKTIIIQEDIKESFKLNYLSKIKQIQDKLFDTTIILQEYNLFKKECSISQCLRIIELAPAKVICLDYLNKDSQINSRFIHFDDRLNYLLIKSYEFQDELLDILAQNKLFQTINNSILEYFVILSDDKNKIKKFQDLKQSCKKKKFFHFILTEKVLQKKWLKKGNFYILEIKNKEIFDNYINILIIISQKEKEQKNSVPQIEEELIHPVDKGFIKILSDQDQFKYKRILKFFSENQQLIIIMKKRMIEFNLCNQKQVEKQNSLKINKFSNINKDQFVIYTTQFLENPQRKENIEIIKKKGILFRKDYDINLGYQDYYQDIIFSHNQINRLFLTYFQSKSYFNFEELLPSFTLEQQLQALNKIYEYSLTEFDSLEFKFPENKELNMEALKLLINFIYSHRQKQLILHIEKVQFPKYELSRKIINRQNKIQNILIYSKQAKFENSCLIFSFVKQFFSFEDYENKYINEQNMYFDFSDSIIQNYSKQSNLINFQTTLKWKAILDLKLCFDNIKFGDNNKLEINIDEKIAIRNLVITSQNSDLQIKVKCEARYQRILNFYCFYKNDSNKWIFLIMYIIQSICSPLCIITTACLRLLKDKFYQIYEESILIFAFQYLLVFSILIIKYQNMFKPIQNYEKIFNSLRVLFVLSVSLNQSLIIYLIVSQGSYDELIVSYFEQIIYDLVYFFFIFNTYVYFFKIYLISIKQDQMIMKYIQKTNQIFIGQIMSVVFVFYFIFYIICKMED